jgi:hypothetical protein
MPRSAKEILAHADELARRFEDHKPAPGAVRAARADGHSWAAIGAMLGTSGEAARQRYSDTAHRSSRTRASA